MHKARRKICVIVPTHWEAEMGGAQFQAKILIEHLIDTNAWDIYYIANWIKPGYQPNGYHIIEIPGSRWLRRLGYMFDSLSLLKILDDIAPDVIYQRVGCAYTGIAAFYAKRHSNSCKMFWHVANDSSFMPVVKRRWPAYILHLLDRKFLQYGIHNASHIIAQTKHQGELLRQQYARDPTEVIPNFHPLPRELNAKSKDSLTVLWVANFKPSKRPEIFVRLAKEFSENEGVRFLMIGGPYGKADYQEALEKEIATVPNLDYLGARSQEKVNQIMADAHLFVSTAAHEGFANTFIQAWLHRVPVVSLEVNPDGLLNGGPLGYAVQDFAQLVATLRMLIADPLLIESKASAAEQYARSQFSEENVALLINLLEAC